VSRVPVELVEAAQKFGEKALQPAGGVKSVVGIGERHVFKLVERGKGRLADQKEQRVLRALASGLPDFARRLVPVAVEGMYLPTLGFVEVHSRLPGQAPQAMSATLADELGMFLRALHGIPQPPMINEFEGEEPRDLGEYLVSSAVKFQAILDAVVEGQDRALVAGAVDLVRNYASKASGSPGLVIVHKDLSLGNLLVDDGHLTGIVDWAAAQTAPREWEFAIIAQRLGDFYDAVIRSYGIPLDNELLRVCGALQAIRFWKSFVDDEPFVENQRRLLRSVL